MIIAASIWILTFLVGAIYEARFQIPLARIQRQLRSELGMKRYAAMMIRGWYGLRTLKHPEVIFDESDTAEIRDLKTAYVGQYRVVVSSTSTLIKILFVGMGLAIIAGLIKS